MRHEKINQQTIERYIELFKDSFLLREARRYDLKGRKEIGALRKYYFCDTGLRNARLNFVFPDEGQMLENIVYNELCYNGYSVSVGSFDTVEKIKKVNLFEKQMKLISMQQKCYVLITYKSLLIYPMKQQERERLGGD